MKIRICFKTPDATYEAIKEYVEDIEDEDDREAMKDELESKLSKWIKNDEYVNIEFDLKEMKATVL
jgi:hypothetical protein